jgi:hypothetical protein
MAKERRESPIAFKELDIFRMFCVVMGSFRSCMGSATFSASHVTTRDLAFGEDPLKFLVFTIFSRDTR